MAKRFGLDGILDVGVGMQINETAQRSLLPGFNTWQEIVRRETNKKISARRVFIEQNVAVLPEIDCFELILRQSKVERIPAHVRVHHRLRVDRSPTFKELPSGFSVDVLELLECTALEELPEGLQVYSLDLTGCVNLKRWPQQVNFKSGFFSMADCSQLDAIPPWLKSVTELDVSGCTMLHQLSDDLIVTGSVDVHASGLTSLPAGCGSAQIRWRGVLINEMIAFHPEQLTSQMVLAEQNVERRRVMIEQMGMEKFFLDTSAQVLDTDTDSGGVRSLLCVPVADDEPIVCLNVTCPSTGRRYLLRVPPTLTTCHSAAAWIAGFEDPSLYLPLRET